MAPHKLRLNPEILHRRLNPPVGIRFESLPRQLESERFAASRQTLAASSSFPLGFLAQREVPCLPLASALFPIRASDQQV